MWLLVLVTLSGTMAMHIFVPALTLAGQALGASASSMQQTITLYMVGLAVGQLIYGPVSDVTGRRPALLLGLGIYLSASLVALFATTVEVLSAARLLQALGGAAGLSLGRAIVRDTATPARVTKDLALLNLLALVGPGLAPILGSYLASDFGWRAIYVFLVIFGCAALGLSVWRLPETNVQQRTLQLGALTNGYAQLLFNRRFAGFTLGGACCSSVLFPYLATVSYIVHEQMGLPIQSIGWFAAVTIAGAGLGTLLTRRLSGTRPPEFFLTLGVGLQMAVAVLFVAVYGLGWLNPAWLVGITVTMTMGAGIAGPAALGRAMGVVPSMSGSAAGIYGFNQMAMGALSTFLVGYGRDPVVACAVTQFALALVALGCFRWAKTAATPTVA
ncbi:multidrug effflux MFS transporter [Hydrogenophaga sp. BPS33]|nr:multidrug effflux MFS transporter [Hydrogenophaga sp. BPS33]